MRIVGHRIEALRAALRDVILVRSDRHLVAPHRICIAAHALVDVRRHVHHVTRRRHQRKQAIGSGFSLIGLVGFHQMNVEMQRAGMLRIAGDHFFRERHNLRGSFIRQTVTCPVTPRAQVHH